MKTIQVLFSEGTTTHQTEIKLGQSLLKAGYNAGLDAALGYGECGGNMACGTCLVTPEEGAALPPPSATEQAMLDTLPEATASSRLGCQLKPVSDIKVKVG